MKSFVFALCVLGGGATLLSAIELSDICSGNSTCVIGSNYANQSVENHNDINITTGTTISLPSGSFNLPANVTIATSLMDFTNYGTITTSSKWSIHLFSGSLNNLTNYGTISGAIATDFQHAPTDGGGATPPTTTFNAINTITNYGSMGGLHGGVDTTIDNRGVINTFNDGTNYYMHFKDGKISLKSYAMIIDESKTTFTNAGAGGFTTPNNSHIITQNIKTEDLSFYDANSKLILDFGNNFEIGAEYPLNKLIVLANTGTTALDVDFSRLTTRSSLYKLTQNGDNFIVSLDANNSEMGMLYKANVRAINNLFTTSNSAIYPHRFGKKRVATRQNPTNKRRVIRRKKVGNLFYNNSVVAANAIDSLEGNETFFYNSDFMLLAEERAIRLKRLPSRTNPNVNRPANQSANPNANQPKTPIYHTNVPRQTNRTLTNTHKYNFVLMPFVSHNYFFESGRYNLSGLDYGFITAFSGEVYNYNTLGVHFGFSYGTLSDKNDKDFNITNMNLMLGINYKLDLIWDMYLKARGDFFYFLNQMQSFTMAKKIKPNNMGFGVSVAYGKDFNLKNYGILGLELGIDYKALNAGALTMRNNGDENINETYKKQLYNLIYVDLGVNYGKYFSTSAGIWGLNAGLGIRGNVANNLAKSQVIINNNISTNMTLDNDKILGYANIAGSYVLSGKTFDMEFSLAYYGSFGDRAMSNGGGFEWRVAW